MRVYQLAAQSVLVSLLLCMAAFGQQPTSESTDESQSTTAEQSAPAEDWDLRSADEDKQIHAELVALRESLVDAVVKKDIPAQIAHAHPNIVVTWQNNEVVRGQDGLREFMETGGGKNIFQGYNTRPAADEPTILYGDDVGVVFGKSVPHYRILGMEFDLANRWTAVVVKRDGRWRVAAYHVSGNVLDNPVLNMSRRATYLAGGLAGVAGLLIGSFGALAIQKRRRRV